MKQLPNKLIVLGFLMSASHRAAWALVSSLPLAVCVNDCLFGFSIVDCKNGGAGMTALGGASTPERAIVLSRKRWTFSLWPVQPGDSVVIA